MKQIFIDPTSKNCMFNCVEPQGSYLFHRFGKRDIPEEHLDIILLKKYLDKEVPEQIILESVFGDPLEYKHLKELLVYCKDNNINTVCVCNGYSKNFDLTDDYNVWIIFKLFAFDKSFNTFFPESDFNRIKNNLVYCNKILYHLYEQNLCDIENVYNTEKDIEFIKGPLTHDNLNHIITSEGKWMYDINGLDNLEVQKLDYRSLKQFKDTKIVKQQTMHGYHLLKNYVLPFKGKSILNSNVYKFKHIDNFKNQLSISYKGHIFDSIEERNIITNAYIPDWSVEPFGIGRLMFNLSDTIKSTLSKFANSKKISI